MSVKFEHVVAAIEEAKDLSKPTLDELCGSLEAHEKRMGRFSTQSFEQAFQSKVKSTDNKNTKNKQEIKLAIPPNKGIKLEEDEENKILEVEVEERDVFQAKENFLVTLDSQCIICKNSGHESKIAIFDALSVKSQITLKETASIKMIEVLKKNTMPTLLRKLKMHKCFSHVCVYNKNQEVHGIWIVLAVII